MGSDLCRFFHIEALMLRILNKTVFDLHIGLYPILVVYCWFHRDILNLLFLVAFAETFYISYILSRDLCLTKPLPVVNSDTLTVRGDVK